MPADDKREFVDHFGLFFETAGGNRTAGRMFGWLLISDPPHQSIRGRSMIATRPVPARRPISGTPALAGTGSLIRLILRRDRVLLPVWILGLAAITSSTAAGVIELYSTPVARQEWAAGIAGNPMELALVGPIFGSSSSAITSWQVGVRALLGAALAGLLMVIRHTRAEEEAGRRELLGSRRPATRSSSRRCWSPWRRTARRVCWLRVRARPGRPPGCAAPSPSPGASTG
ncbi:hypothetical protein GCM10009733_046480 [Nonomuraea maheshkhaliensis]|uniref:MFS transporter n=1 Tax=Nonomuraea maheshkhaliensis TaxID=419590 RepID=A0ABP4RCP5_9ACTN